MTGQRSVSHGDGHEVVVIGAGIMGASCAHHLSRRGARVTVLEAAAGPAEGSTGRSFASVRTQWTDPLNVEISWRAIQEYRRFPEVTGASADYRPSGYMFLVPEHLWEAQQAAVEVQRSLGAPVEVLTVAEARRRTEFDPTGVAGATWGSADGVIDPVAATQAYLACTRQHGGSVRYKHRVSGIERSGSSWTLQAGDDRRRTEFSADFVVNAAGGWAGEVARLAGLTVPVGHSRRCIYSTGDMPDFRPVPMTVDMATGGYLRSEGARVLFALSNGSEPSGINLDVDWEWFEEVVERLAGRFPWLLDAPIDERGSWAGSYEVTPDHLPVLGRCESAPTWLNACGFSGHGVMQAPTIGLLTAEELLDGRATTLDIDPLRESRFARGRVAAAGMVY